MTPSNTPMEVTGMLQLPCPWCEQEVVVVERADGTATITCDECATIVDLAPDLAGETADRLPLAA